jgi:L-asparaginase
MPEANDSLIHIRMTGGTIDSVYDAVKMTINVSKQSFIPEYFEQLLSSLKPYAEIKFSELFMKDSRDLTPEDRKEILKAVEESEAAKIIVTHGTYTIPETARFLKENLENKDKVVVLVGSMIPLKDFDFSDAPFNLGYAFAQVQKLSPGIYVCMNARVFTSEKVAKNIPGGRFYSLSEDKQ